MLTSALCQASDELGFSSTPYEQEYRKILKDLKANPSFSVNSSPSRNLSLGKSYRRSQGFAKHKFDKNTRVMGWEISPKVYFGQTKVLGEEGVGIVIDKGEYVFGINTRRFSIMKRF